MFNESDIFLYVIMNRKFSQNLYVAIEERLIVQEMHFINHNGSLYLFCEKMSNAFVFKAVFQSVAFCTNS